MAGPRTTRDEETLNVPERVPDTLSLRIVLGDRVVTHELPVEGEVTLGRGHAATVFVDHASVSRLHARLRIGAGGGAGPTPLSLEDLDSANHTRVAGRTLAPQTPTPVRAGDAIELGDVVVVIQRGHVARPVARRVEATTLGRSAAMREVERVVERIAPGSISVLIAGETGVGKEVIADAIHRQSRRVDRPFVRLNCAAVAEQLLESEWFGYERGAFTGAAQAKPGLLETADGGTVLLDEVAELPMALQAKLLRVVEERSVMRVGGVRPRRIDVRFLAATHRDLEAEITKGTFRQDLYFRLNGVTLHVPPLRERREEIRSLASVFMAEAAAEAQRPRAPSLDPEALAWLEGYAWPGNVRELRNVVERAVLLASDDTISIRELPDRLRPVAPTSAPVVEASRTPGKGSLRDAIADVEKQRVLDALAEAGGNQKRAAELLGIARGTLSARLEAYGIARPRKS
jgi:two-component system, NtrC family, response regulator AtoC